MIKAVRNQIIRDVKVFQLASTMESVYSFVDTIQATPSKSDVLVNAIKAILAQTVECALFIREYVGKGFGGRSHVVDMLIFYEITFYRAFATRLVLRHRHDEDRTID